ncbi:MAG TPA: endonuclease/exonuclease/phosphatase family protein, partial [Bdellovibrionota bacterium]|nr:endonuclease/exonuclease/phosphatase family protein [Bdellovibrionota bacterium]
IHKGFSSNNKRFVLDGIREALGEVQADLVFLQEVLGHHAGHSERVPDWPSEPQFEYLADKLWPHFAYGKNAVYTSGHHGNAILSRYPIVFHENIDVSTNRLESRGLLHAQIEVPGASAPLHAICVHLGLREADRRTQVDRLCDRIESHVPHAEPLVIGGDFNDWRLRATPVLSRKLGVSEAFVTVNGDHPRTFPAWLPALRLDRIYVRGMKIRAARCMTGNPWRILSDHTPLVAELGL